MAIVHPIEQAWLSTGGTGAQNYDEFADEAEITAIIEANPASALSVEMPHRAPGAEGDFEAALPLARQRLQDAQRAGRYTPASRVVVLYRITGGDGSAGYGMFAMVDTDQISSRAGEPGLVVRNEDVFAAKVRERIALAEATGHLLSPVLLMQSSQGEQLQAALADACAAAGSPAAIDLDHAGRRHEIWPLPAGETAAQLCALAGGGELVVADGNHRTLAAQLGGLPRFLAVITSPEAVTIAPYHRLVTGVSINLAELTARITAAGGTVTSAASRTTRAGTAADVRAGADDPAGVAAPAGADDPAGVADPVAAGAPAAADDPAAAGAQAAASEPALIPGTVTLYIEGQTLTVRLPADPAADRVDNLDHARVERVLFGQVLRLEPDDKRITYVGGDYPAAWLRGEVDAGRAELAIMIAPVSVDDFVEVNLARRKMPRKSTWFTPKARAGLVLAQLD